MRKIIMSLIVVFLSAVGVNANDISKTIKATGINPSAVSVSVREVKSGQEVYSMHSKSPMTPASTLKLVTSAAAYDTLGSAYNFSTELYKSTNNDLYLVLSGDPFLKSSDLEALFDVAKQKNILTPKNIYIDDYVFDGNEWGEGWQWDDDLNPLMQKFSAYNLDKNLLNIEVVPGIKKAPASISIKPFYPLTIMNMVITNYSEGANKLKIEHNTEISSNILNVSGSVSKTNIINIPVPSPKKYFKMRLEDAIRAKKIEYYSPIVSAKLPDKNVYLVHSVVHDVSQIMEDILKNSCNLSAESLVKAAGAFLAGSQGNFENSSEMINGYLEKLAIPHDDIRIVDGSGVSKNNLMTSDFMTSFLTAQIKVCPEYLEFMASPGEGTLKNRMLYFKDNLKAKTGTLSDTSAIAGYITSRKGKVYAFDIMIKDAKTSSADKKNIKEQILRHIYTNY